MHECVVHDDFIPLLAEDSFLPYITNFAQVPLELHLQLEVREAEGLHLPKSPVAVDHSNTFDRSPATFNDEHARQCVTSRTSQPPQLLLHLLHQAGLLRSSALVSVSRILETL